MVMAAGTRQELYAMLALVLAPPPSPFIPEEELEGYVGTYATIPVAKPKP